MKLFDIVWKDIIGFEGLYQINNIGEVKSLLRFEPNSGKAGMWYKERILKSNLDHNGYPQVILHKCGKAYTFKVHRLVVAAFLENPKNLPCVNHKDENKLNNDVLNLEWCDIKYNNNYNNRQKRISEKRKKPIMQFKENGDFVARYDSIVDAVIATNGTKDRIIKCCKNKIKHYKNYIWKYENF